jgi:hypothetical protein
MLGMRLGLIFFWEESALIAGKSIVIYRYGRRQVPPPSLLL